MSTEVLICSACGEEIFRHHTGQIQSRVRLPSRVSSQVQRDALTEMMREADELHHELVVKPAEEACHAHMSARHPWRYRLWQRFRKDWLLRKWLVR